MIRNLRDNGGFALILTILVVSVITALTLQFNTDMRSDVSAAATLKDEVRLRSIARSGLNYAMAVLFQDGMDSTLDTQREPWADPFTLSSQFSSLLEKGQCRIQVLDGSGKIGINRLVDQAGEYDDQQKQLLTRFLSSEQFNLDSDTIDNLVDAIKDWIDTDDEITRFGAENSYYQSLEEPYQCSNRPLRSLEELLLVRGVTRELFYGSSEGRGISAYLTVHGDGRININTADPLVLKSLSDEIDDEMVENMLEYRSDEDSDLSDPSWYRNVPAMSDVTVDPDLTGVSSTAFEIVTEARLDQMRLRALGAVTRENGTFRLLSWRYEF